MRSCRKIVVTGGPGAGKTTAIDLFRRELGEKVVVVPEAATLLYEGGLRRKNGIETRKAIQMSIYQLQKNLEHIQECTFPDRILLCDRGTLDSAVYWPGPADEFFDDAQTSIDYEMKRYDGVVFFQSAASGGLSIEGGNPSRVETAAEAAEIDRRLLEVWSKHPNFRFVSHDVSFMKKIVTGLAAISELVDKACVERPR